VPDAQSRYSPARICRFAAATGTLKFTVMPNAKVQFSAAAVSRRALLGAAALGAAALAAFPARAQRHGGARYTLIARPGKAGLRGPHLQETDIWGFEGRVPGPVLRVRQGERLDVQLVNRLAQPTTIHWHGIRVPNDMDGVPNLTQHAVMPNEVFPYSFACADAGTYWYHPHGNGSEQLGRGLSGVLVVEERQPPRVDRELIWVLSDWKLKDDGSVDPDFANPQERSHEGRIGDRLTVNGAPGGLVALRRNERVRIRLLNVANARIFEMSFEGHDPWLIALDGQPVPLRKLGKDKLVLGPGMRADLLLDAVGDEGERHPLLHYPPGDDPAPLLRLVYRDDEPLRARPLPPPQSLPPNPIAAPVLARAQRHELVFAGGAQPGMHMPAQPQPQAPPNAEHAHPHGVWTVNGQAMVHDSGAAHSHARMPPIVTLKRGTSVVFTIKNSTVFDHPIHFHGHTFRVLSRNGKALPVAPLTDTVLLSQQETAEIAFVADNPGDWMLHCHILEHQEAGMGAIFRVAS
jgi:FtsP/CotA-like multicopper oxidase with cupredoxin domain